MNEMKQLIWNEIRELHPYIAAKFPDDDGDDDFDQDFCLFFGTPYIHKSNGAYVYGSSSTQKFNSEQAQSRTRQP